MTEQYVMDCLFDLINESDMLDIREIECAASALYSKLYDGSRYEIT